MEKKKWLLTEDPAIIFEDTAVGRMKKAVWDMNEAQLDAELEAYGIPSPSELGVAGTYIQNTPRANQIESAASTTRVRTHRLHGKPRHARQHRPGYLHVYADSRRRPQIHEKAGQGDQPCVHAAQLRRAPVPPHRHAGHGDYARRSGQGDAHLYDAGALERRLPQDHLRQQPWPPLDAGERNPGVLQALSAAGHLPRHRMASRRARVFLPH